MTEPESPPHKSNCTLSSNSSPMWTCLSSMEIFTSPQGGPKSHIGDLKETIRVQSESTVSDATHTWRGWKVREQPVEEGMDISPAEANVVVQEKGTRVNKVETRVNEVETRVKGKSKVAINEDQMGNDDVGSSTNNWKGKEKAVDKPKFITPTLPDPTDKAKLKQPAPNDDTASK